MYIHSGDFKLRTMMNESDSRLSFGFRGKSMMSGSSSTTTSCDVAWQHGSGRWRHTGHWTITSSSNTPQGPGSCYAGICVSAGPGSTGSVTRSWVREGKGASRQLQYTRAPYNVSIIISDFGRQTLPTCTGRLPAGWNSF